MARALNPAKAALIAGAVGGAAEMLWVLGYGGPAAATGVAREVTATLAPAAAPLTSAPLIGIVIHMVLSLALALVLARALLGLEGAPLMLAALGALATVWALNFLVVLPLVNPAFVTLMPIAETLASKLLFGASFGWTLMRLRR